MIAYHKGSSCSPYLYNVFIKLSSSHIEAVLGAVVLQFVAALVDWALLLYMKATGSVIYSSGKGLCLAVGGVAVALIASGVVSMAWPAGR